MNSRVITPAEPIAALHAWAEKTLSRTKCEWQPLVGDAGFRQYFRLSDQALLAVYSPPASENNDGFVKIAACLKNIGVHAPDVKAYDLEKGFLLISDLGCDMYAARLTPHTVEGLYGKALDVLAHMQTIQNVPGYDLAHFDAKFMLQELLYFKTWFLENYLGIHLDKTWHAHFDNTVEKLLHAATTQPQAFMHRDYHSRNLMVCDKQTPGVLDFQDAMIGPVTYDAVSLLRDAYVDWPQAQVLSWASAFYDRICDQPNMKHYSRDNFIDAFNWMGVERHLKAIFIFARKFLRDGTPAYLNDIPRCIQYVMQVSEQYSELYYLYQLMEQQVLPRLKEKNI